MSSSQFSDLYLLALAIGCVIVFALGFIGGQQR